MLVTNIFYLVQYDENPIQKLFILFLVMISSISLYKITNTNPGYVYSKDTKNAKNLLMLGKNSYINTTSKNMREIIIDGDLFIEKYCTECNMYTNEMISHCNYCECCVMNKDHHCLWVGNCITRSNYKIFLWLINSTTALLVYSIFVGEFVYIGIVKTIYMFTCTGFTILMVLLCLYFWILVIGNISSRDFIKGKQNFVFDLKKTLRMFFELDAYNN
ncbi:Palmitoyltransferase zdhhc14 [Conglomerata obtusa]